MAAKIYGTLSGAVWGTEDETGIIVSRIEADEQTEDNELDNGQGDYVHMSLTKQKTEFTMDFELKAAGYPDADLVGSTITIENNGDDHNGTYIVKNVNLSREKGGWKNGNLSAVKYPLTFTTGTTTTTTTT
jgi:hypothetical protein